MRLLNFNTPAGWENYMREARRRLVRRTTDSEEIGKIASHYDFRVA